MRANHNPNRINGKTRYPHTCIVCGANFLGSVRQQTCSAACRGISQRMEFNNFARFWAKVAKGAADECWPWTGFCTKGYGRVKWHTGQESEAHRVAYIAAFGPIPNDYFVCHTCDNPPCCNPAHLFVGTPADNVRDRNIKERQARGERAGNAVLTAADVSEIRRLKATGLSNAAIAARVGCCATSVWNVVHGCTWRHV